MAVLIRAKRVEDKIRKLARQNGETLTRAVEKAIDSQLAATTPTPKGRVDWARLESLQAAIEAMPTVDGRSPEEIIGFNERGHFD
jgi:antitoxin VapB